jgi:hypothetical protein
MHEKHTVNFNNIALQNGLITGFLCIIYTLILYLIDIELVLSFWLFVAYSFIVAFKIITANVIRKKQHNFISFRQGLKYTFMISAISLLMWILFNTILFKYIDRDLITLSKKKAIERTIRFMEMAKAPEHEIEKAVEKAEQQSYEPSLKFIAMNYAGSCIVGFLYSFVISIIFYLVTRHNEQQAQTDV